MILHASLDEHMVRDVLDGIPSRFGRGAKQCFPPEEEL